MISRSNRLTRTLFWFLLVVLAVGSLPFAQPALAAAQKTPGITAVLPIKSPAEPQAVSLVMTGPSSCPNAGCAAGQRLNVRSDYDLSAYDPALAFNVQVCLYTPINWSANSLSLSGTGGVTQAVYTPSITYCQAAPDNYTLLGGAVTSLTDSYFGDSLGMAFRIGNTALSSGSVLVKVFERTAADNWVAQQAFLSVPVYPLLQMLYVANDPSQCNINGPCFVNSADDFVDGIGTGLKDAIDAQIAPATINILGTYLIKSHAVLVDKPATIRGLNDAVVLSGGASCVEPLLRVSNAVTIRDLNFNGGSPCGTTRRDLIEVNSPVPVLIESNDFINGDDAIRVLDNQGNVTVQFNHISGNTGYALIRDPGTGTGQVEAVANNLFGNRPLEQVECASKGRIDHNYWGVGIVPVSTVYHCTFTAGKRLGAEVQRLPLKPGVDAQRVTVGLTKQYFFNNQIAVNRTDQDSSNFDLYIVNHGANGPASVPFTGGSPDDLIACSNYWDLFLATSGPVPAALNVYFKYNLNSGCVASVESSSYCAQSDPSRYPLWWYDPAFNVTQGWDKTGQNPLGSGAGGASGQVTTCNMAEDEIQVAIDGTGRPNLLNDLSFTPFIVGLPSSSSGVVITRFVGIPGDAQATIQWSTSSEVNILGFYVQRSSKPDADFVDVSPYFPHRGTGSTGADYEFTDSPLSNGTTVYYRIRVVNLNLTNTFTGVISVVPLQATATPTTTSTPTQTTTPTGTSTTTITPTLTGTATVTATSAYGMTGTATSTATPTVTQTGQVGSTSTATLTLTITPTPTTTMTETQTGTPSTSTPTITRTPTRTPTRTKTLVYIATRTRTLIPTYTRRVVSPTSVNRTRTPTPINSTGTPSTSTLATSVGNTPGGYPGDKTVTITPVLNLTSNVPSDGYPGITDTPGEGGVISTSPITRGTMVVLTDEARLNGTKTPEDTTGISDRPGWVTPLIIISIGLLLLLGLATYLWLQGVLPLPIKPPGRRTKTVTPMVEKADDQKVDDAEDVDILDGSE